jgi:hypothetical protein
VLAARRIRSDGRRTAEKRDERGAKRRSGYRVWPATISLTIRKQDGFGLVQFRGQYSSHGIHVSASEIWVCVAQIGFCSEPVSIWILPASV